MIIESRAWESGIRDERLGGCGMNSGLLCKRMCFLGEI